MGWIKNRILAEKRKHYRLGDNEWAKIAEAKIISTIKAEIQEAKERYEEFSNNWTESMADGLIEDLKLNTQSKPKTK